MQYFYQPSDAKVEELEFLCSREVELNDYPHAHSVIKKVVIYDGDKLRLILQRGTNSPLKNELHHALKEGPGVIVIRKFYSEEKEIGIGNRLFSKIIQQEESSSVGGDHFSGKNINKRIWNVFEKTLYANPQHFINYYQNPLLRLVAESWLGPAYQITAQVNLVQPGSPAQTSHRDYHLGFQNEDFIALTPLTMQITSQYLTLQGAISHCDMSVESGPTKLLPFSQQFSLGYLAMRKIEIKNYFEKSSVQIPLSCGDAVFFSPALFHAAGENRTLNVARMGNLLQISSAFGRPMEQVDRLKMCKFIYPFLLKQVKEKNITPELECVIKATASGYSFPTNLDVIPPGGTPITDQTIMLEALREKKSPAVFEKELETNQI